MTARTYDVILSVGNASAFQAGNNIVGASTLTTGIIAAVDKANNKIKVKQSNLLQEFSVGETIRSNIITTSGTANGYIHSTSLPFQANTMSGNVQTASTTISSIAPSSFIAEKNAFTQNPIVRLYSIYYPGEWYPPNANGNPTGTGTGYAWPTTQVGTFPLRFAEIVGDKADDINYNVTYGGVSYVPYPMNVSGLEQASDGKINELSLTLFNSENIISYLVENPYLAGINYANSVYAIVNGELVYGIDPRTVETSSFANAIAQAAITKARASGLAYNPTIVAYYNTANAMFDKTMTDAVNGTWIPQKMDTRDLLGGAVEIKTTFANFLDYWPEYSLVSSTSNNIVTLKNTLPYRVGDQIIQSTPGYTNAVITAISSDSNITLSQTMTKYLAIGTRESTPEGFTFKPDGTKFYITGSNSDRVQEYNLSTPYDVSTATYLQNVSITSIESQPSGIAFSDLGTNMYVIGYNRDNIARYTLSTAWNVTTATFSQNFNVAPYEVNPTGISFAPDGSNVYFVGSTSDKVFQVNLAVAWDLSTASYMQNLAIGTLEGATSDIFFKPDGSSFYLTGTTTDKIFQYNMTESWNLATATYYANTYIGFIEPSPSMLAFSELGDTVYFGGSTYDTIHQVDLTIPWEITSVDFSLPVGTALFITNPQADTASYLVDNYKIDQLESLTEQVATFGLVSWLQYFKIVTPKRKFYKNTCQWQYKGDECQYPGPGGLPIPGTTPTKLSPSYNIGVDNLTTAVLQASLINTSSWTVGTAALTDYPVNGDGNSRIIDTTPYGDMDIVWDVSNQDAASDADGGWNQPQSYSIDTSSMYRFSMWVRRKTIGNGSTYLGPVGSSIVLNRSDNIANSNPYFYSTGWWGNANDWYLLVGHVWPYGSGAGSISADTGIYTKSGTKLGTSVIDFIWSSTPTLLTGSRAYLYYSTNTATNQQFYNPRIDKITGNQPTITDLLNLSPSQITGRAGQDICAKSLEACSLRNNDIHFGGFPGVGRTVPQM